MLLYRLQGSNTTSCSLKLTENSSSNRHIMSGLLKMIWKVTNSLFLACCQKLQKFITNGPSISYRDIFILHVDRIKYKYVGVRELYKVSSCSVKLWIVIDGSHSSSSGFSSNNIYHLAPTLSKTAKVDVSASPVSQELTVNKSNCQNKKNRLWRVR